MGGLGKTTLARRIYDHQNINTLFGDTKIWICVSQNFNIIRLLNEMVEAVTSNKADMSNKDGIIRKLEEKLKGKRFLLVLDDVWKEDQVLWDSLRESLKRIGGLPGSVILITTRSKNVADAARAVYRHELKELSKDDSWELLKQNVDIDDGSCLEEIGRRIVNKCKGVPLAINVIGCLLESKKNSLRDWEVIETSELWELPQGKNDILPSLLLSFNHLPSPSLKQCFACCAIFPKGRAMAKDVLITHWLAQGFLHIPSSEARRLTEEDIGADFCGVLLNNLFLQEAEAREDGMLLYKMHDLVHDLAVYISKDIHVVRETDDQPKDGNYRHLLFTSIQDQMVVEFSEPETQKKLRTISFEGIYCQNCWVHARYLHTLMLNNADLSELPPAIGLLKHLRFLDLSYNPIRMLPETICKLYHLQTLTLRGCKRLTKLPSLLNRLVNLRHIFTTTPLYASRGLAELKNLQNLPHLALKSDQGWTVDELGALPQLTGEICIHGLEHVKNGEQAGKAALYRHGKVMKMTLTWAKDRDETSEGYTDEDVLDNFHPHPAMSSIELKNFYGKAFPSWIMKMAVVTQEDIAGRLRPLSNLIILKLLNCRNCQTLPILGHLPSLSTLIMSGLDVEFIGSEFYGNCGGQLFGSLRKLVISSFPRLTTWMVPTVEATVVFPRLESLQVEDCPMLKAIPALHCELLTHLKLDELSSIESLDIIKGCTGLTSLEMCGMSSLTRLPDELANCRNLQELEIQNFVQLTSLPSLKSMECLKSLRIFCQSLISLPDDFFHGLSALHTLFIFGCINLRRLPSSFKELTSLQKIGIYECELENVGLANLSVLRELWYLDIPSYSAVSLRSMLEATEQLPNIKVIGVQGFKDEQQLEEYFSDMTPFLRLQSVKALILSGCSNIRSLPEQLGLLTRITTLDITGFDDLEEIPDWLCNLSSLETLKFMVCHSLRCLPSKEAMLRLTRLRCLEITNCPLLTESYVNNRGPEWHKIEHLSYIEVDEEEIF
ncbi:putative disease resistance protein RGA3 isoform X2 [Silene latifolia]